MIRKLTFLLILLLLQPASQMVLGQEEEDVIRITNVANYDDQTELKTLDEGFNSIANFISLLEVGSFQVSLKPSDNFKLEYPSCSDVPKELGGTYLGFFKVWDSSVISLAEVSYSYTEKGFGNDRKIKFENSSLFLKKYVPLFGPFNLSVGLGRSRTIINITSSVEGEDYFKDKLLTEADISIFILRQDERAMLMIPFFIDIITISIGTKGPIFEQDLYDRTDYILLGISF